eukprot:scaffold14717_cov168-Ochromonas_danica.AAC.17
MLINYKEEVDTLNEALKIAAMDIAEVGQDEDDDEDDMLSMESEEHGHAGEHHSVGNNSMSTARRTLSDIVSAASSTTYHSANLPLSGSGSGGQKAALFVINEDGSYIKT